jgi:hypothetical protein
VILRNILAVSLILATASAHAGSCTDVIALSRTTKDTIESSDSIDNHAANFCSEYYKKDSSSKTAAYAASYKMLSASMSTGKSSESEVAAKYCSGDASNSAKQNAYRQYVESISSSAYKAYEQCISLSASHISFDVDSNTMLPRELVVPVAYHPTSPNSTTLRYTSSSGIDCHWATVATEEMVMPANTSAILKCSRAAIDSAGFVTIINQTDGAGQVFTLNWPRYNKDGIPINLIESLLEKFSTTTTELSTSYEQLNIGMRGSVTAFKSETCPTGWTEYTPAYGRFIRGVDRSKKIDPSGERKVGDIQDDALKEHSHEFDKMTGVTNGTGAATMMGNSRAVYKTWGTSSTGDKETRPKNVSLLYCERL